MYHNYGDGSKHIVIYKCVGGTLTSVADVAVTYSSGAALTVAADGSSITVYYNNAIVGTTQTVSDAGILNNTLHGLISSDAANTLDNFLVFPRGNGNEFAELDRYIA